METDSSVLFILGSHASRLHKGWVPGGDPGGVGLGGQDPPPPLPPFGGPPNFIKRENRGKRLH